MRFDSLQSWLHWQETLHPENIELDLDRIRHVAERMAIPRHWPVPVVMVAGTNGKGSSIAMLESIYQHAGYRTGSYTSPHILRYNERVRINRQMVSDDQLCVAFEKVDQARHNITLTYFEFGTLAALDILLHADIDILLLEVGLGGRLDAVNIVDADVALITTIDLDHQSWLGDTREKIAFEKAGIIKPGSQLVCGEPDPPETIRQQAETVHVNAFYAGVDFHAENQQDSWTFHSAPQQIRQLPQPNLSGEFQRHNSSAVLQAIACLQSRITVDDDAIRAGLTDIQLSGRYQCVAHDPDVFVDVAHNPEAMRSLGLNLQAGDYQRTIVVLAMLADKAVEESVAALATRVDTWFIAGLDNDRGLNAGQLAQRLQGTLDNDKIHAVENVPGAIREALNAANQKHDRVIITGSFYTVAEALQYFGV